MKTFVIIITGFFSFYSALFSQTTLKIGHVYTDEIMAALPATDSARVIIDKETKEYQSGYEELTAAYNKLYDEYQKDLPSYTAIARKNKEDELLDKQKRMSDFEKNATQALQKRNGELLKPIFDKINKAITKVATEDGFTYILDISKGGVVFTAKDSQDITAQVIKALKP